MTIVTIAVVTVVVVTFFSKKKLHTSKTDEISQGSFSRSRDVFFIMGRKESHKSRGARAMCDTVTMQSGNCVVDLI